MLRLDTLVSLTELRELSLISDRLLRLDSDKELTDVSDRLDSDEPELAEV